MLNNNWQDEITLMKKRDIKARIVLGISENANIEEIKHAFHHFALINHPDINKKDSDAANKFHLICCAYKYLIEGEICEALDEFEETIIEDSSDKYCLNNSWGYWCWWRDKYFKDNL